MHKRKGALHKRKGELHRRKSALHRRKSALHKRKSTLHKRKGALHKRDVGLLVVMTRGRRKGTTVLGQNYRHMDTSHGPRWTLLCEAPNKWEALFIRGSLQSAGIAVHIVSEAVAELYGITHGSLAFAKIFVPEADLQRAQEILAADPEPEPDADEDDDKDDDKYDDKDEDRDPNL